ncbi:MAG TPA: prephenate dehydratase [Bacillota bacterium]|nr:prephenate dehydratase [Bacillota bacterium]
MNITCAYLGPEGTYSQLALQVYLGRLGVEETPAILALPTIAGVVEWAAANPANLALVPLENSLEGAVTQTLDLLANPDCPLKIRGELILSVSHHLLVRPGTRLEQIKQVLSHPQALGQCREYLNKMLPGAALLPTASTAEAATIVGNSETHHLAAIGNLRAAEANGLIALQSNIQDGENNCTRFIVLGHENHPQTGQDKTSIVFTTPDRPGALYHVLGVLTEADINLSKIESRPTKRRLGEYLFHLDLEGHVQDRKLTSALRELANHTSWMKILGSYPIDHEGEEVTGHES